MEESLENLTPDEKIIICATHRQSLKNQAARAINDGKIFKIYGNCETLRKNLIERGWIEKIPDSKLKRKYVDHELDLKKAKTLFLSKLIRDAEPNLVYNAMTNFNLKKYHQNPRITYNMFYVNSPWTQKQAICAFRRNNFDYITNVAEVNTPRTYNSCDTNWKEEFVCDYKLTACTGLLKWVLSMTQNKSPIFADNGNVNIVVLVFAINRCKEYLRRKQQNNVSNCTFPAISNKEWDTFFKYYNILIMNQDFFDSDGEDKFPLYLDVTKILIQELQKYETELICEGYRNIWIIKPLCHTSGHGIKLASNLDDICKLLKKPKYVLQKYIEEPMLIHQTKFSIRQFFLITSTSPLEIWMYGDCYLIFCSRAYTLKSFHESIHLSSFEVQRQFKNSISLHWDLPINKMWSLNTFKEYLQENGDIEAWDTIIYPGMKKAFVGVMFNFRESLPYTKNRFELFQCDFILGRDYKPWLIGIKSCPNLESTTTVTADICTAVISDMVKVVIDRADNYYAETGRFECIFGPRENWLYMRKSVTSLSQELQPEPDIKESKNNEFLKDKPDINTLISFLKIKHQASKMMLSLKSKQNVCSKKASQVSNISGSHILDAVFAKSSRLKANTKPKDTNNNKIKKEFCSKTANVPQSEKKLSEPRTSTRNKTSGAVLGNIPPSIEINQIPNAPMQATTRDRPVPLYFPNSLPYAPFSIRDSQMQQYSNNIDQKSNLVSQNETLWPYLTPGNNINSGTRVPVEVFCNLPNSPSTNTPIINKSKQVLNGIFKKKVSPVTDCYTNSYGQVFVVGGGKILSNEINQQANIELQTRRTMSNSMNVAKERLRPVNTFHDKHYAQSFGMDHQKLLNNKNSCSSNIGIQVKRLPCTKNVACEYKQPVQISNNISSTQTLPFHEQRRKLSRTSNVACECNVPVQVQQLEYCTKSSVEMGRSSTNYRAHPNSTIVDSSRLLPSTNNAASEHIEPVYVSMPMSVSGINKISNSTIKASHTIPTITDKDDEFIEPVTVPMSVRHKMETIDESQRSNFIILARHPLSKIYCNETNECIVPVQVAANIPYTATTSSGLIPTTDINNRKSKFTIQARHPLGKTHDAAN